MRVSEILIDVQHGIHRAEARSRHASKHFIGAQGRPLLLLGEGGRYGQKALRMRAEMLQHLRSEVLRLGLSVHLLKYELTRWFDEQPVAREE